MAKFYTQLIPELQNFIKSQQIFFTATAPQAGRINLSPKGIDTFCCIDSQTVAYLDLVEINSVQTSCGAGVPMYEFKQERQTIISWAQNKGEKIQEYWQQKNQWSIDGLPTKLLKD